ncbi:MAG TPA: MCE family protein [Acidimicrobiales bacterium]|nr:MCE family protein [Acidimicrobiales bacterium]
MKGTVVKLAAFMVVCLVFTAYLAFTIGNIHPFRGTYSLSATFDDVTGLLPNDNVKVAGVVVGKVGRIKVVKGRAQVTFSVRKGLALPADTEAAIRWRNLLGQRYVYLYPGTASTVLQAHDRIAKTRAVVDLGELFNRLGPIVQAIDPAKVNTFLDAVVGALDGNEAKLRGAIDDLATLTQGLAQRDDAIQRMIGNLNTVADTVNSRDQQIKTVLDNLVLIAQTFSQNTAVLERAVANVGDVSDNITFLLSRNREQVDSLIANLVTLTNLVHSKLPVADDLLSKLTEGAKRLFTASRYGDWLNQIIPCGRIGYPASQSVSNCPDIGTFPGAPQNGAPAPPAAAAAHATSGTAAVRSLMAVASP